MTSKSIQRRFFDLPSSDKLDMEREEFSTRFFGSRSVGWSQLLESDRVLLVSEAGMGKTFECRQAQKERWEAGDAAFFIELADLANGPMESSLGPNEHSRFVQWERAESERAVFFFDSVDELSMTQSSFASALRSVARTLKENLGRACIVITTRPISLDRELIEELLPIPERMDIDATEEFVHAAMRLEKKLDPSQPPAWRFVALAPLDEAQMRILAAQRNIDDVEGLLVAITAQNAEEYAKRPLDFFELCDDWIEHRRIQAHRIQLDESIDIKLRGRRDRKERQPLSQARAREGASQIALAMLLAKKLTVWHGTDNDSLGRTAALDPFVVLSGWNSDEVSALLERPLFGFANYGRVRFYHRSAMEFLAAERLVSLKKSGLSDRTLRELISAFGPDGKVLIRPSMQAVSAWLARDVSIVRRLLLNSKPDILLHFGDPESLDTSTRRASLRRYVECYGMGGWRGESVPSLQVRRFASKDLGEEITSLWLSGISNPEVRETLLELIGEAKIETCAGIAYEVATNTSGEANDRFNGLQALAKIRDSRLSATLAELSSTPSAWPLAVVYRAIIGLFPAYMSVVQLIGCLDRMAGQKRSYSGIASYLPVLLSNEALEHQELPSLRAGLYGLVSSQLSWNERFNRIVTKRRDLVSALAAVCVREVRSQQLSPGLAEAIALASVSGDEDFYSRERVDELNTTLESTSESLREEVFWSICELVFRIAPELERAAPSWRFFVEHHSGFRTNSNDIGWLLKAISNHNRSLDDRELALEMAIDIGRSDGDAPDFMSKLENACDGSPSLTSLVMSYRHSVENPPPEPDWVKRSAKNREEARRKREADTESWRNLHRELLHSPDAKFSPAQVGSTLLNLWRAMENTSSDLTKPGWNRGFVERVFDKQLADRFRGAFSQAWRRETPSLRSERPADEKGTSLRTWRIGLAGLYAEAEDPQWAAKLTDADAQLACRYSLIDPNRLSPWVDDLIREKSCAVDEIIGGELGHELRDASEVHVMLLQYLRQASKGVAEHFVSFVRDWLNEVLDLQGVAHWEDKHRRAIDYLLEYGAVDDRSFLRRAADEALGGTPTHGDLLIWVPVLGHLDGSGLVDYLERLAAQTSASKASIVVQLIGALFGHSASYRPDSVAGRPDLLLRLVRIANQHVRPEDDQHHEEAYSPGSRDNAQDARSSLFGMLMDCKGPEAWRIKMRFANDGEAARYRDRVRAIAEEGLASELDSFTLIEKEIVRFERDFQYAPKSRGEMAALLLGRLDDLDEVLSQDGSPREMWAGNSQERLLRREVARTLRGLAGGSYVAVEEAVTADEKETDIRLISKAAPLEAVIELKVGENGYSIADFEAALRDQLVARYMAPENRRVGALVISWAGTKTWQESGTRRSVTFDELVERLNEYAQQLVLSLGEDAFLVVRGLNLAPRKL
jgi:hypothetical protein